jgi:hypothetical protein
VVQVLVSDPEQFLAGDQQVSRRCAISQCLRERAGCVQQVFAVVKHEEHRAIAQYINYFLQCSALARERHAQRLSHGRRQQRRVGHRCQFDHPNTVLELAAHGMCRGLRKSSLANPGGTDNAHKTVRPDRCKQNGYITHTADQFRQHLRQVACLNAWISDGQRTRVSRRGAIPCIVGAGIAGGEISYLQSEPVPASRNCRDRAGPEKLSQRADLHLQIIALDHEAWPHRVKKLVLPDRAITPLDQRHQQVERMGSQRYGVTIDEKLSLGAEQIEAGETVATLHGCITSAAMYRVSRPIEQLEVTFQLA